MHDDSTLENPFSQTSASETANQLVRQLQTIFMPLLKDLDAQIDKRLVGTFLNTNHAILEHRHRNCGLLLSERSGFLLSPDLAPAGTKRTSNLLRCVNRERQRQALRPGYCPSLPERG